MYRCAGIMLLVIVVAAFAGVGCGKQVKDAGDKDLISYASSHVDDSGLLVKEFDLNRDQQPDVFKYYKEVQNPEGADLPVVKLLIKRELDLNGDAKIDVISMYNDKEELVSESFDLDFDGRIDLVDYYANGQIMKKAIDFAFDEKPDMFKYYMKGQIARIEKDTTGNGRIDHWEYYADGELERIGLDIDNDGKVDTWKTREQVAPEPEELEEPEASEEDTKTPLIEDTVLKAAEMKQAAEQADQATEKTTEQTTEQTAPAAK